MRRQSAHFPAYDFERNKGYPCPRHKLALKGYGPTPIHRRSWVFMENLPWLTRRLAPNNTPVGLFDLQPVPPPGGPTW
jgi:ribonuclease HII